MNIAVFRALQLGDMLCAVPALRALRGAWPHARIALVGLPWAREFVSRFRHYVDEHVEFPGYPGLPERPCDVRAWPGFIAAMQARRFDLAIQLHGSGRSTNALVALFGAQRTAGFYERGDRCPDAASYVGWRNEEHEVLRSLRLLSHLGLPLRGAQLEFPLGDADHREWAGLGLAGERYVVVHPGAQLASRRWLPARFAQVADAIASFGYKVVLTGTAAEAPLTRLVALGMRRQAIDLAGRTTLGGVAAAISRARLLVSNDTGVSHIAAALRTPSVVVCNGADPVRWAPLDRSLHRVLHHPVPCRPCGHPVCPIGHPCATGVGAGEVIAAAQSMLALGVCAA